MGGDLFFFRLVSAGTHYLTAVFIYLFIYFVDSSTKSVPECSQGLSLKLPVVVRSSSLHLKPRWAVLLFQAGS